MLENRVILECVCVLATKTKAMRRVLVSILSVDCSETPRGWEEKEGVHVHFLEDMAFFFYIAFGASQSRFPQKAMHAFA